MEVLDTKQNKTKFLGVLHVSLQFKIISSVFSLAPQTHQLTMTQLSTADRQDLTDKQTNRVTSGDILSGINTAGGGGGGGEFL